ncbi:ADP-ribose pyrophosphatase YjhB (NUDIX family) [Streptomyces aurantiacus]|uniref:NUDIX domain-containing protein n=1 Tax=Streptomyces aurantiacus TaxID=47760 RepID=UPI00279335D2|nr:NUDIX domain-containing protein [Streptomyces aurantiacus]MDQ0773018.1 ADP-ribose pyrophosphatase YjhB (NUDIX family) [Streptomyces aurantiacus]
MAPDITKDWFTDPPPRRVGVHALIVRDDHLLVVSRPYRITVSQWGLPGGSAGADELPRRALSRTLDERLGLRVTPGRWLAVDHVPATPGKHAEGTNWVFEVQLPEDVEPAIAEGSGFGEARWVGRTAAGELAVDHALRRIEQSLLAAETGEVAELYLGVPVQGIGPHRP